MAQILIEGLSVEFAIYGSSSRSLKNTIMAQATGGRIMSGARDVVAVRALDNLSLHIRDGDRIGLVGHNGSGKTTLLRVLAGIYKPSSGQITIEGRVGTLLDPAAGMDHEATGLENIFLRGHLLGMNRRQIEASIDDIADFTDLGDFLRLPMKTYSAGMAARLAFGISTAMHNDILLIDEGIGAGDAAFQEKAQKRIENLFERTRIVLLASHSDDLIRRFCNRRVEMHHGKMVSNTPVESTANGNEH
jgi:ABC-2 type transport system ATP-binding protein/lipopolysaccharide transport system ATP-binding protein